MAFPSSPTNGQQATVNNTIYQYNTAKSAWVRVNPGLSSLTITGNANVGNVISSGYFWANGVAFTSSNYGNTQVAAYLTGNVTAGNVSATGYYFANGAPFSSSNYGNTDVAAYLTGNVTTGNVSATGYYFANGAPFTSSNYGNTQVAAYLTGNVTTGNVSATGYYFANGTPLTIGTLTSTVDAFTGNGVQTDFTLSVTPTSKNYTFAAVGGVIQPRSVYSVAGTTISFTSAPPNGSPVEVTTMGGSVTSPAADLPHPFMLMGV